MNKNKVVIIFAILLSFFIVGGGCYSLLRRNKVQEIEKEPDVLEVAKKDILLFRQQLNDYKQERKVCQEDLEKSIEILKDQGIWKGKKLKFDKRYKEYLDVVNETDAFQLRLDELLEKVEEERNLESFREELEKLSKKYKKDIDVPHRIQEEAKKPMPFLATWIGLIFSVIFSLVAYYVIFYKIFISFKYCEGFAPMFLMMIISYVFYFFMDEVFIFINYLFVSKKDYKDKDYFIEEIGKFTKNNSSKDNFFIIFKILLVPAISGIAAMLFYIRKNSEYHRLGDE